MKKWTDECMDGQMDGWIIFGWQSEWMDERMREKMSESVNKIYNKWISESINKSNISVADIIWFGSTSIKSNLTL